MMKIISAKVENRERLSEEDALWLFEKSNLTELGELANRVNLRKNGRAVFYNINRHINPTNICALSCKFCAYSKKIGEEGGYAYEIDEMIKKAGEAVAQGATELHMVGGLHPRWPFQRYVDMIAAMHKAYPEVHLKAFTAVELDWMARRARKSIAEVMQDLQAAGLGSFPGGGAEIFHPEIRDQICDTKVSGDQWIDTHRTAHRLGLRSNCTMLYGHIENFAHRVDHMRRLRDLQDETGGFNVFIPLAFQPFQNEMGINRYTFGSDDLRTIAVARLYLDNFSNIKSYWVMLGQDIAQLALHFGANDLDGTVLEEKISRAAGGRAGMIMTRSNLEHLIQRSGRIPVERTTLYQPVNVEDRKHLVPVADDRSIQTDLPGSLETSTKLNLIAKDLLEFSAQLSLHDVAESLRRHNMVSHGEISFEPAILINAGSKESAEDIAARVRQAIISPVSIGEMNANQNPSILLNCDSTIALAELRQVIIATKNIARGANIIIQGLRLIVELAKQSSGGIPAVIEELKAEGVSALVEDPSDAVHLDLDTRWKILDAANFIGIRPLPSITLLANKTTVDWESWAQELENTRQKLEAHGDITNFAVQVAPDTVVMPSEYLKAIALAKLTLPEACQIWTPLQGFSALSPQKGLGASDDQHPIMKLVSTLGDFGSSGFGYLPTNIFSQERVVEDILASGRRPRGAALDGHHNETAADYVSLLNHKLSSLRHIASPQSRV